MGNSFRVSSFPVLPAQRKLVEDFAHGLSRKNGFLLKHIFVNNIYRILAHEKNTFSPTPWKFIHKHLRGADLYELVTKEKVDLKEIGSNNGKAQTYSRARHLCQEARIKQQVLDTYFDIANEMSEKEYLEQKKVDLFSGKKIVRVAKSRGFSKSRNKQPGFVVEAMRCFKSVSFDKAAASAVWQQEKEAVDIAAREHGEDSKEHRKAIKRARVDGACLRSVLDRNPKQITESVWQYRPAYFIGDTGRIYQYLGGLESCTREMKQAAYSSIDGLKNYDLHNSQIYGVLQQFEAADPTADLNTDWLLDYLENKRKRELAALIGISEDCFKRCLLARVMGAHLPKRSQDSENRENAILHYLSEEVGGKEAPLNELLIAFSKAIKPFDNELIKWHNFLIKHIYSIKVYGRGGAYITNKCGKKLCISELPTGRDEWHAKSKVAAFFLQGQESAFIHHLTILGKKYGYIPIANEHDGLVVIGEIPEAAKAEAACLSELKYPYLESKSFVR